MQLPWYSVPEGRTAFPSRATPRRRRRRNLRAPNVAVALPTREVTEESAEEEKVAALAQPVTIAPAAEEAESEASTIAAPSEPETPATSQAPSESDFTNVSTPATPAQATPMSPKPISTHAQQHTRRDTRSAIAIPSIPGLAKAKIASPPSTAQRDAPALIEEETKPQGQEEPAKLGEEQASAEQTTPKTPLPKPKPKSWADLVRRDTEAPSPSLAISNGKTAANGIQLPKTAPLAEALRQYNVNSDLQHNFLEPRGLVNTGNMCYMNSVRDDYLQDD